jgi:hypothetical protein
MRIEQYTPDTIAQCMGLCSFFSDLSLQEKDIALRVLLQPSFHPEVLISITSSNGQERLEVIAARTMIFRQFEPAPMLTDRCEEPVAAVLEKVSSELSAALVPEFQRGEPGIAIDGMPTDILLVRANTPSIAIEHNVGRQGRLSTLVGTIISLAWDSTKSHFCKNALAEAGKYAGLDLPHCPEPPRKPTIETMVLGNPEDKHELMEALKMHHRK